VKEKERKKSDKFVNDSAHICEPYYLSCHLMFHSSFAIGNMAAVSVNLITPRVFTNGQFLK